jgi:hypothetical protein
MVLLVAYAPARAATHPFFIQSSPTPAGDSSIRAVAGLVLGMETEVDLGQGLVE